MTSFLWTIYYLPTKASLRLSKSEDEFVYENPTPTGDSTNNIFASAFLLTTKLVNLKTKLA